MIAGILELQMMANLARLSDDMSQAKIMVGSAMNDINHVIGVTQKTLGALGFAFGTFSMGSFIKNAIDAEDAIYGLQQRTGSTAEEIAGLQYPASQTNTSLTELADAAKHLANNMAGNPDLFRRAGITAHDSIGALVQFSGIISAMPDGLDKTALATKTLGKSGDALIQFLNMGPDALRAMIEEGKRYNPVTEESARLANEFNDNLEMLGVHSKKLALNMANDLLPPMNSFIVLLNKAFDDPGKKIEIQWFDKMVVDMGVHFESLGIQAETFAAKFTFGKVAAMHLEEAAKGQERLNKLLAEQERIRSGNKLSMEDDSGYTYRQPLDPNAGKALSAGLTGGADKELKEQMDTFREWMRVLDVAPQQVRAYELVMKGATKAQIEAAQAVADYTAAMKLKDAHTASDPLLAERSRYKKQLALLRQFHDAGLDSDAEYSRRLETAQKNHQNNLVGIVKSGDSEMEAFKQLSWQNQTKSFAGFMADMTSSAAGHNRAMFEVNKYASIANATISTYEGANKALATFPPPFGAIAAAAVITAGLVNVSTIMGTSFGGGSAASGGGGIPSMSTSPGIPVSVQNPSATVGVAAAPAKQFNLTLYGIDPHSKNAQFTYDQVFNELMPLLAEADGNGATDMNVIFA